jgi:hypothetical protein
MVTLSIRRNTTAHLEGTSILIATTAFRRNTTAHLKGTSVKIATKASYTGQISLIDYWRQWMVDPHT